MTPTAERLKSDIRAADDPRLRDNSTRNAFVVLGALAVVLAVLPLVANDRFETIAVQTLIFAIIAVGWNLMSGYGGLFSFGHAAFFGIGAYTDAYLVVEHGISPWIAMVVGAAIAALAGVGIASLCLRYELAGPYFALATFAFAQLFLLLVQNLDFLRRTEGFNLPILPEESFWMLQFERGSDIYVWIPAGLLLVGLAITILYVRSRAGQFVQAARDDEVAAASLGINVMRVRLGAVALSCGITSVAGTFYTQYHFFVGPHQAFGAAVSIEAIIPAVIGGIGTIWGPLVGALIVGPLAELIESVLRDPPGSLSFLQGVAGLDVAVYAALLIVIVLFMRKGIYGTLKDRWRK
ncbi:branched-chain amino acid ABC transporter permease [Qaidamihabitans albus]|uniref:branched-chain amino acid ABC transporter permease n=1 Tax=Qaidamihabitans albus TaxID=2795733 RepID=UPI0018F10FCD|nr:branched-chain amino acid ABC transporter permease [Qaidamihabitans albus]